MDLLLLAKYTALKAPPSSPPLLKEDSEILALEILRMYLWFPSRYLPGQIWDLDLAES
jgi:hypothetical protein